MRSSSSGLGSSVWPGAGPAWCGLVQELVFVLVNGWKAVQSSVATRILHHAANGLPLLPSPAQTSPLRALCSACPSSLDTGHWTPEVSPAPVSTCIAPLEWPSIRAPICQPPRLLARWGRMGLGALAFHHNLFILSNPFYPKSNPSPLKDRARVPPFRSSLIAEPFIQKQRFPL